MLKEILILVLAGLVLLVSCYITYKKNKNEKLVCYIGEDCNKVLRSKYSKLFLGIPNEIVGIFYYVVLLITSIAFLASPALLTPTTELARQVVVGIAALFSLALIYIQIFKLREFCEYCMAANVVNIMIFVFLTFF